MRVVFSYIAQLHQIPHSLPIAADLSLRPGFDVRIACTTDAQETLVRELLALYPGSRLGIDRLKVIAPLTVLQKFSRAGIPHKRLVLIWNRAYFKGFDAAVVPERTSLILKRLFLPKLRIIGTEHGAGDRAITFAPVMRRYDFVLMGGRKQESRLLAEGLIRSGCYHVGCYAKFDLVDRLAANIKAPLFTDARPIVLYNPHWVAGLSSWEKWGFHVLERLLESGEWNVIFAPHIRLFDTQRPEDEARLERLRDHPRLLIDLGSARCIDMTYTNAADVYLGDVSSQVVEYLARPRPCIFLNAHGIDWRHSPDYRFWHLGPVLDGIDGLMPVLNDARREAGRWRQAQQAYIDESLSLPKTGTEKADYGVQAGTRAIADFLAKPR